jgi:GT2 family glycosyltransferase
VEIDSRALASPGPGGKALSPVVWIVVLNWNRPQDTVQCVSSLRQLDYPAYRMLVVDNGSTDESVEVFRKLPDVDLLVNDQNLGFAAGNNRGIEYALERGADYVLLLNNDTTVSPSLLAVLVEVAETDRRIGIVGPIIYYLDRPADVWFAGMRFRYGLYVARLGLHLRSPLAPIEDVDFISGCGMFVRRETWQCVGLFDPRFFMYYEDLDLCIRARRAGYRVVCATQGHMWHALSASTGGPDSPLKQYYQVRSTFLFCEKHTRGLQRVANISIRLGHAGLIVIQQVLSGQLRWEAIRFYLKGVAAAMKEAAG